MVGAIRALGHSNLVNKFLNFRDGPRRIRPSTASRLRSCLPWNSSQRRSGVVVWGPVSSAGRLSRVSNSRTSWIERAMRTASPYCRHGLLGKTDFIEIPVRQLKYPCLSFYNNPDNILEEDQVRVRSTPDRFDRSHRPRVIIEDLDHQPSRISEFDSKCRATSRLPSCKSSSWTATLTCSAWSPTPFELASMPFDDPSINRIWKNATDEALARAYQEIARTA